MAAAAAPIDELNMGILRGSIVTLFYRISGTFFWMLTSVITARALGVGDLGVYVSTVVVVQAIGTVAASFASGSGYFVSHEARKAEDVVRSSVVLSLLAGGALLALALILWTAVGGEHRLAILVAGVALPALIMRSALGGVALGTSRLWRYNLSVHGPAYVNVFLLAAWLLLWSEHTAEGALTAWAMAQWFSLLLLLMVGRDWWPGLICRNPDWALVRKILGFGAIIGLAGFVSYFNYRVDQLLVAGLDGVEGAGAYSRAVTVAEGLWLVSTSIAIASYARVGTMTRDEAAALTTLCVRHTLLVVVVAAAVTFAAAPWIIDLLFGDRYSGATNSLRVLCIGTALFAPQSIVANYFTVHLGKPRLSILIAATSCCVNISVSIVLIPRIGYIGGAWATTISYVVAGVVSVVLFLRHSNARALDLWRLRMQDLEAYARVWRWVRAGHWFSRAGSSSGHPA